MSRLRRPFLYDRFFSVIVKLLASRAKLEERDYSRLANSLARMRQKKGFSVTARVFLPDHWHAILYPPYPLSIAQAMSAIKVSSMVAINRGRQEESELWQERYFDRAQRTVKECAKTVEYIHLNPVKRGLVTRPEDWKWSSFPEYAGVEAAEQERRCGLTIDRVPMSAGRNAKIQ